jgi:predicted ATPase
MLEKLQIKNLGCFDDKDYIIPFKKMTMLMGPNNSGKSMSFVGLNYLKSFVFYGGPGYNNARAQVYIISKILMT